MSTRKLEDIGRELAAIEAAIRACGYLFKAEPEGAIQSTQAPLMEKARELVLEMNEVIASGKRE